MSDQRFLQLLQSLQQPNTEQLKAATTTLKKDYYTSPSSLKSLLHILETDEPRDLRQLAAVEARKLVKKHWLSISATERPQHRQSLLQSTLKDATPLIRHAKARVVAAVAEIDINEGSWAELPGLLQQAATSPNVRYREVGVYVIFTLLETLPDMFEDNLAALLSLFNTTIQDPESIEVRINTMRALSELAMSPQIDEDKPLITAFQSTIPHMVRILQECIAQGREDAVSDAFNVFISLLAAPPAYLNLHFKDLMQFMIGIAGDKNTDDDTRVQAIAFLEEALESRKLKFQALRIGETLTAKAMDIVLELDEEVDDDESSPARAALDLLSRMALNLNPSQVAVPLLNSLGPYVQSQDPKARQAAMLALGMCVDGASEFMGTQLPQILPVVYHLLEDPNTYVRSATLHCLSNLAESLQFEIAKEHSHIIPTLIKALDMAKTDLKSSSQQSKQSIALMKSGINAVGPIIESLESDVATQYLDGLLSRIVPFLEHDDTKLQLSAIMAVGQIASTVNKAFMPYFSGTMQALGRYVSQKESEDELTRRGITCDTLGQIATAVGKEAFEPYLISLMQASEEALHLDHPRLRETSYMLWGELSKVYGEAFAPYLDGAVKGLIECMSQEERSFTISGDDVDADLAGKEITFGGKTFKVASADDEAAEDMDEDGDEDGNNDWDDLAASNAISEEKEVAIEAMGDVILHTGSACLPFIERAVEAVLPLAEHGDEAVRKAAINTCWMAYRALWTVAEERGMPKWSPGLPLQSEVGDDLKRLGNLAMTATLSTLPEEADSNAVEEINGRLAETLKLCGPAILVSTTDAQSKPPVAQIVEIVLSLLRKKHICQQDPDDPEGSDAPAAGLNESSEYEWQVIDSAVDVINGLSAALGSSFAEIWPVLEKPLLKYTSSQSKVERSNATGAVAECIENMAGGVTPFTAGLMKIFLKRLSDEDVDTRSNAAYGIGVLCMHSQDEKEVLGNYGTILARLEPMLQDSQEPRLLDNLAGAVARMIHRHPTNVPLDEVLPSLLRLLPLRKDYVENKPVFNMIIALYQAENAQILKATPQLMPILEKVLAPPEEQLVEETRVKVMQLAQHLQTKMV